MSALIPFDFETNAMRVVMEADAPVFVAHDVCRALAISKYRDAIARLDEDERVSVIVDTLGGRQTMTAVTEPPRPNGLPTATTHSPTCGASGANST